MHTIKNVYFVYCNHILACRHFHLVYAQEKPDKLKLFQSLRPECLFPIIFGRYTMNTLNKCTMLFETVRVAESLAQN